MVDKIRRTACGACEGRSVGAWTRDALRDVRHGSFSTEVSVAHRRPASASPRLCCKTILRSEVRKIDSTQIQTRNFDSKVSPPRFDYCLSHAPCRVLQHNPPEADIAPFIRSPRRRGQGWWNRKAKYFSAANGNLFDHCVGCHKYRRRRDARLIRPRAVLPGKLCPQSGFRNRALSV